MRPVCKTKCIEASKQRAEPMAGSLEEGLSLLAERLAAGGQWPDAARCYEAVLADGGALPQVEAVARLRLARLLLRHTHNVHEARQHLERTVRCLHGDNTSHLQTRQDVGRQRPCIVPPVLLLALRNVSCTGARPHW